MERSLVCFVTPPSPSPNTKKEKKERRGRKIACSLRKGHGANKDKN